VYPKSYYRRKRFFGEISDFIWRLIMTLLTLAAVIAAAYGIAKWARLLNMEIPSG
jgi:hypothetical protein